MCEELKYLTKTKDYSAKRVRSYNISRRNTQEARWKEGKKNTGKKIYPYLCCKEHIKNNDKSVECNLCNNWVHTNCKKLDEDLFKALCTAKKHRGPIFWTCAACTTCASKFNKSILEIDRRLKSVEDNVGINTENIREIEEKVKDVKEKVEEISKKRQEPGSNIKHVFSEISDRKSRELNLIIHGTKVAKNCTKEI